MSHVQFASIAVSATTGFAVEVPEDVATWYRLPPVGSDVTFGVNSLPTFVQAESQIAVCASSSRVTAWKLDGGVTGTTLGTMCTSLPPIVAVAVAVKGEGAVYEMETPYSVSEMLSPAAAAVTIGVEAAVSRSLLGIDEGAMIAGAWIVYVAPP